ncbi:hypothetical protein MMC13_005629 [Lambiella insularis]|nr:hypothetical protein [Lambiella insularis]
MAAGTLLSPSEPAFYVKAFLHVKTDCRRTILRLRHPLGGASGRDIHFYAARERFARINTAICYCGRKIRSFGHKSQPSRNFPYEFDPNKHTALAKLDSDLQSYESPPETQRAPCPLDQALKKCQQTYIVTQHLHRLLDSYLEQALVVPSSQGSDADNSILYPSSVSYLPDHELMHELDREQNLANVQRVHQMKRISSWSCEEIQDELKGLQIATLHGGLLKANAEQLFIKRWTSLPIDAFDNVQVHYNGPRNLKEIGVHDLLAGHITHNAVERAMMHWPTLETQFRNSQTAYRSQTKKLPDYGLDVPSMVEMVVSRHVFAGGRAKTVQRCSSNVDTVKAALNDLLAELDRELSLRSTEGRRPLASGRNSDPSIHLLRAETVLKKMKRYLARAEDSLEMLASPNSQPTRRFPERYCYQFEERILQDWGSLSLNAFGGLVTLTLEEVVKILARKPLWDDVVTAPDRILENIPRYLRPL